MKWAEWADERLSLLDALRLDRHVRDFAGTGVLLRDPGGRELVSFASNDYFGLTAHPAVTRAAADAAAAYGSGAGSARLIAGSRPIHSQLERELARWKGEESALLFASGYTANVGVLTAFGAPDVTILSDALNHASIVDGCRLARANVIVYPHRDVAALRDILQRVERAIVVTDAVFSMDGDVAPLEEIAELCADAAALLVVDEAHTALGPHADLSSVEHLRVGTLSKMLGSAGGFVAASAGLIRLLVNDARSFVFTTAGTPADAAAALAALRILESDEGTGLREHLAALVALIPGARGVPIVTLPMPDEGTALRIAETLYDKGFLVPAIRPPTVPAGGTRLRISLSSAHTGEQVRALLELLDGLGYAWRD